MKTPIRKRIAGSSSPRSGFPPAGFVKRTGDEGAERDVAFRKAILAIPPGKVSTYGRVAAAAGYPKYHRAVARLLREEHGDRLPWHRVVGADGIVKTSGASAQEQRARLRIEGVKFEGDRINMGKFLFRDAPGDTASGH